MPSLTDILNDMLVVIANGDKLDGLGGGDPTHFTPPKPSPTKDAPIVTGPANQAIWYWEKTPIGSASDPGYLGMVQAVSCWARGMADAHQDDSLGWMTVCQSITWSPVKVEVKQGATPYKLTLPLTEKYVVKTFFLGGGQNPGKGWWPLEADVDSSFFQVFVYDITGKTSSDDPDPVTSDVYDHADFMPDATTGPLPAPVITPGDTVHLTAAHKQYVCVVMSLVCCKERADFEPGGLVGIARAIPHFMIMTNMPLDGIEASIRIERPSDSGYLGTSSEPGRPPMQHHDMDPPIKGIAATDTNVFRAVDTATLFAIPYWDIIFDFVIEAPDGNVIQAGDVLKVVKDEPTQRTLPGAIGLLDYRSIAAEAQAVGDAVAVLPAIGPVALGLGPEAGTLVFTRPPIRLVHRAADSSPVSSLVQKAYGSNGLRTDDLLPRKLVDVVKWPRQGQFDNIHLAPRMKADLLLQRPELNMPAWVDTLSAIRMAPFCEHDCFHTHWRWGASWKDLRNFPILKNGPEISGFGGTGATGKFTGVGVPYTEIGAPMVPLNQEVSVSFESEHVFNYTGTVVKDIVPGVWQAVYHHGSGYAVSVVDKGMVDKVLYLTTASWSDLMKPEWSEFYWTLRFQDTTNGPLERIEISDAGLRWLMGL